MHSDFNDPVVICVAPNGARRTKADHATLPITPSELAETAARCCAAGARAMHVHVRDEANRHTLLPRFYRDALQAIHAETSDQLILQITTESVGMYTPQQQIDCVREVVPEAASVAIRELIPTAAEEAIAADFFHWAARAEVGLQYIVYSRPDVLRLIELAQTGIIADARPHALFVLGRYSKEQQSAPADLLPFLAAWPQDWPWSLCAFGKSEAACAAAAIALGGHVRVGFENNLLRPEGLTAADNSEQVDHIRALVAACGRPLANIAQAREIYGTRRTPDAQRGTPSPR